MKTRNLIILVLFAVFACSCFKDRHVYYKLTDIEKQMIPYRLEQVISFTDALGQTVNISVTKDTMYWEVFLFDEAGYNLYEYDNCRYVRLQSEHHNFNIKLLANTHISVGAFILYYNSEGQFINELASNFYDSIEINNKVYYDVVEQNAETGSYRGIPAKLLYNKTYGILYIRKDGNSLTINQ